MYYNGFEQLLKFFFAQNFGRGRGNWGDKPNTQRDIFIVDWLRLITSDLSHLYIQSLNPHPPPALSSYVVNQWTIIPQINVP